MEIAPDPPEGPKDAGDVLALREHLSDEGAVTAVDVDVHRAAAAAQAIPSRSTAARPRRPTFGVTCDVMHAARQRRASRPTGSGASRGKRLLEMVQSLTVRARSAGRFGSGARSDALKLRDVPCDVARSEVGKLEKRQRPVWQRYDV